MASTSSTGSASYRDDPTAGHSQTPPVTGTPITSSKKSSLQFSARHHEPNLSNDMIASPSRSSTTVTRANHEDNDDTLVLSTSNRNMSGTGTAIRLGNRRFAEMETWQDEDNETREMDAEEKVDMWRNSGVQEEPESGGSSTTKRRSALPMEFRSNMVSALRVRTVCNIC